MVNCVMVKWCNGKPDLAIQPDVAGVEHDEEPSLLPAAPLVGHAQREVVVDHLLHCADLVQMVQMVKMVQ